MKIFLIFKRRNSFVIMEERRKKKEEAAARFREHLHGYVMGFNQKLHINIMKSPFHIYL